MLMKFLSMVNIMSNIQIECMLWNVIKWMSKCCITANENNSWDMISPKLCIICVTKHVSTKCNQWLHQYTNMGMWRYSLTSYQTSQLKMRGVQYQGQYTTEDRQWWRQWLTDDNDRVKPEQSRPQCRLRGPLHQAWANIAMNTGQCLK